MNAKNDAVYIPRLLPNFLAENKGKNLGTKNTTQFKFFGGHFLNLEKGIAPSGF